MLSIRLFARRKELFDGRQTADRHRLLNLFESWHLASLSSAASSSAIVQGFRRRREAATLAGNFRAWASLARARLWVRRRRLRRGLEGLMGVEAGAWRKDFDREKRPGILLHKGAVAGVPRGRDADHSGQVSSMVADWRSWRQKRRWSDQQRGSRRWSIETEAFLDVTATDHRRRSLLSRGLRALVSGTAEARTGRLLWFPTIIKTGHGDGAGVGVVVVRTALLAWRGNAEALRSARRVDMIAEGALRRRTLVEVVRDWRGWAMAAARRRGAEKAHALRRSFVALRQVRWCGDA